MLYEVLEVGDWGRPKNEKNVYIGFYFRGISMWVWSVIISNEILGHFWDTEISAK